MKIADKKYQEAKKVHNIAGILANRCHMDIDDVYVRIVWPLAHMYESAYNAFLLSVSWGCLCLLTRRNPDVLKSLNIDESVRTELAGLIASRMAPQATTVRAASEVT